MSIELKVKSKHLSEEARIIRFEERKVFKQFQWAKKKHYDAGHNDEYAYWLDPAWKTYWSLTRHRCWDVRNENRATFLARAYLKGVAYNKIEMKRKDEVLFRSQIFPRICAMVVKYGKREQGDWEWDKVKQRYAATKQLKDKIAEWCDLKQ
jgi:hypothetical protein